MAMQQQQSPPLPPPPPYAIRPSVARSDRGDGGVAGGGSVENWVGPATLSEHLMDSVTITIKYKSPYSPS